MENTVNTEVFENNGNVNISDEVVAVVASLAAAEVKGIAGMVSGVAGGIAELIGKKSLSKGVKIVREENKVTIDLSVIVEYGAKIPDVAWELQEKVKSEVELMTGLEVVSVNVSVDSVNVPAVEETPKTKATPVVEAATEE